MRPIFIIMLVLIVIVGVGMYINSLDRQYFECPKCKAMEKYDTHIVDLTESEFTRATPYCPEHKTVPMTLKVRKYLVFFAPFSALAMVLDNIQEKVFTGIRRK